MTGRTNRHIPKGAQEKKNKNNEVRNENEEEIHVHLPIFLSFPFLSSFLFSFLHKSTSPPKNIRENFLLVLFSSPVCLSSEFLSGLSFFFISFFQLNDKSNGDGIDDNGIYDDDYDGGE